MITLAEMEACVDRVSAETGIDRTSLASAWFWHNEEARHKQDIVAMEEDIRTLLQDPRPVAKAMFSFLRSEMLRHESEIRRIGPKLSGFRNLMRLLPSPQHVVTKECKDA